MDHTLHPTKPLLPHSSLWPARLIAALRGHLSCLLAARAHGPVASCAAEPDLPEAIGATDAELSRLAHQFRRDPANRISETRLSLSLLGKWWT